MGTTVLGVRERLHDHGPLTVDRVSDCVSLWVVLCLLCPGEVGFLPTDPLGPSV